MNMQESSSESANMEKPSPSILTKSGPGVTSTESSK